VAVYLILFYLVCEIASPSLRNDRSVEAVRMQTVKVADPEHLIGEAVIRCVRAGVPPEPFMRLGDLDKAISFPATGLIVIPFSRYGVQINIQTPVRQPVRRVRQPASGPM
jgi:hypothetical protein